MKIAVSCSSGSVDTRFGHCESFSIYEAENGRVVSESKIPNPGHRTGYLPNFLADMGVGVIIAGGMGGGAVDIFGKRGVEIIIGAQGDARGAAEAYLRGELRPAASVCQERARSGQ